jgi:hypothetical protein
MGAPPAPRTGAKAAALRKSTGEFVGEIFYGTLLREMQKSKFKTKYLSGGRAEEAFQGQLASQMSKRIGGRRTIQSRSVLGADRARCATGGAVSGTTHGSGQVGGGL